MATFPSSPVQILYASATGTAEDVAQSLAETLLSRSVRILTCSSLDTYPLAQLPSQAAAGHIFIFVVATCGDGEVPYSMRAFWRFLLRVDLPGRVLQDLRFAVFGLGDRAYVKFNAAARKLCLRLGDLGGKAVLPLGLGDDSAPGGYEATLGPWLQELFSTLIPGTDITESLSLKVAKESRVEVKLLEPVSKSSYGDGSEDMWGVGEARHIERGNEGVLHEATVAGNNLLTDPQFLEDNKEVRHIQLNVSTASPKTRLQSYVPGDIVHVMPRNRLSAVDAFFELTNLDGERQIHVRSVSTKTRFGEYTLNISTPCPLRAFVSAQFDLSAAPRRSFFERLAPFATQQREREKLEELGSAAGAETLTQYVYREKRTVLMVLRDFPSARPPLVHLVDMLPTLKTRPFSIASSVNAHPGEVHVCASIVRYVTPLRFSRVGLVSAFFLRLQPGDIVPIFLERGTALRFDQSRPCIMVGPGTGVAPMRSFVSSCGSGGPARFLFFGCRSSNGDFLYKREWEYHRNARRLSSLVTALSRENSSAKTYVQDKMREHGEEIWKLVLSQNGHIYVAGSAGAMPKGVRKSVVHVCVKFGGLTEEGAETLVRKMEVAGRMQMECW